MMKVGYTKIPNSILKNNQLSRAARQLLCILLRHCGKDDRCFPSQKTLAHELGCSDRHIRNILNELERNGLIRRKKRGFNKSNSYEVAKLIESDRNSTSEPERNKSSAHIGSVFPLHEGTSSPPNINQLIEKDNTDSKKGLEKLRKDLFDKGIKRK